MNKEQQIEEIEQFIYDYVDSKQTEKVYLFSSRVIEFVKLVKPFTHNKGIAEALYNAGYRKTFTSDFASNMKSVIEIEKKNAVKEFAEKLQKELPCRDYTLNGITFSMILASSMKYAIDKLLKEYEQ